MAINHFKQQGDDNVKFDLHFDYFPHFCYVLHGLSVDKLAEMDTAVKISQGNQLKRTSRKISLRNCLNYYNISIM